MKLNAGCGTRIMPDCINLDIVFLEGVDVIHDLTHFPYPFRDNSFEEIYMINVLEHLPDTMGTMDELYRISQPACLLHIRVPYWNCKDFSTDPTHVRSFNENTFGFFDPRSKHCQTRPYYSKARFEVLEIGYYICLRNQWILVRDKRLKAGLAFLATYLCNIIRLLQVELKALK